MTRPANALKTWWSHARQPGESLKAFARREPHQGQTRAGEPTTATRWLERKRRARRGRR